LASVVQRGPWPTSIDLISSAEPNAAAAANRIVAVRILERHPHISA
jgi:hypothetical protein